MPSSLRRVLQFLLFSALTLGIIVACNQQPQSATSSASQPLSVGSSPWPGFAGHYVALEQGFFEAEGLTIQDNYFQIATDVNTGLLAEKLDIALTGVPDMVVLADRDPSLRLIMLTDYSDGADGILARNISSPEDLRGKEIAWENLPLQALLLQKYLDSSGLTEADVTLLNITAAEAASAFAAGKIDVAVTYEPWLSQAAEDGQGEIIFSSKNTNIIPVGLVVKASVLQDREADILAYMRGLDRGVKFVRENPDAAAEIVATKLGVTPAEVPALLDTVRLFDLEENRTVAFNTEDSLNVIDSLKFATQASTEMELVTGSLDAETLYDDSLVKAR